MRINQKYPLKEYAEAKKEPVYCTLCGKEFVVPLSYNGDKEAFVKDLFSCNNQDKEASEAPQKTHYIDIDGYKIPASRDFEDKKLDSKIINRMVDAAVWKYNSAIRQAKIHKKIDKTSQLTLNDSKHNEQFDAIMEALGQKSEEAIEMFNKFITDTSERLSRNTLNLGAKIITAPLLLSALAAGKNSAVGKDLTKAAMIVVKNVWQNSFIDEDKNKERAENINNFLDKVCSNFIKTTVPVITKFAKVADKVYKRSVIEIKNATSEHKKRIVLGAGLAAALGGGGGLSSLRGQSSENDTDKKVPQTEIVVAPEHESIQTKFYNISDVNSLEKALKETEPLIHRVLLPTEFFSSSGYTDNYTTPNTLGAGLFYYPIDGNPDNSCWIPTSLYLQQHPNEKITYERAMELTMAWAQQREKGRIMQAMATQLKGCTLTQNQLAAIYSVYYNSEASGLELCQHIQDNPDESPIETAAFITTLQPKPSNGKFDNGILKRHCHEALVYLNYNDYCNKILDFNIQSGLNSKNKYFISTAVTHIKDMTLFDNFVQELSNNNLGTNTDNLINKMLSYKPRESKNTNVTSIKTFIDKNTDGNTKAAMLNRLALPSCTDLTTATLLAQSVFGVNTRA